jgi:MSHA pilin protein MshC
MTTPTFRSPRYQSGFTMLELVTIMLIVGIMAIVVLPRFDLLRGFDEIGYRDKVKATLEYARKSAVAGRRNVQVAIAGSGLTLTRQTATPEGEGAASWVSLNLPGTSTNSFAAPGGVTLNPDTATIIFDPLGRPVTLSASSFTVSGGAGTIVIEAETGYVH